ncbi:MAG: hypothetical protein LBP51_07745 [Deferribacteraceae bacterium]|jgi:hypothetical protein|nr:hypothetical protein [Deferribacteraceae bacterium]
MEKNDFKYNEKFKQYSLEVGGMQVEIDSYYMTNKTLKLAEEVLKLYPSKLKEISEYLAEAGIFTAFYGDRPATEVAEKLHEPIIRVTEMGGVLSYTSHELDEEHIIELEFVGALKAFDSICIDAYA